MIPTLLRAPGPIKQVAGKVLWGQLLGLRATAGPDAPVFASRSGKLLERSRVTRIVRDASQRAGMAM